MEVGGKQFEVVHPVPHSGGVSAGFHIRAGAMIELQGGNCVDIKDPTTSSMRIEGTE